MLNCCSGQSCCFFFKKTSADDLNESFNQFAETYIRFRNLLCTSFKLANIA